MPKFTNISDGPRGLRTTDGLIMLEAGETSGDVKLAEDEDVNDEWFEQAKGSPGRPPAAKDD